MENASWSCVNGLRGGFFEGGVCLFLVVAVDTVFTVVFCRFARWVSSRLSFSSRARFLDVLTFESGTGRSEELDEEGAIVLVRLVYVFLTVVVMAGIMVGCKWYCGVWIVRWTPNVPCLGDFNRNLEPNEDYDWYELVRLM
jgi:hypothetical protein